MTLEPSSRQSTQTAKSPITLYRTPTINLSKRVVLNPKRSYRGSAQDDTCGCGSLMSMMSAMFIPRHPGLACQSGCLGIGDNSTITGMAKLANLNDHLAGANRRNNGQDSESHPDRKRFVFELYRRRSYHPNSPVYRDT